MKHISIIALILAFAIVLVSCGAMPATSKTVETAMTSSSTTTQSAAKTNSTTGSASSDGVKKITAEEAYKRMKSGDPVVIVDVRTAEEYAEKHIPGAILVPLDTIGDEAPADLPVKDAELLIYCRSGHRSAQASAKLAKLGYTNVNDFGGIKDWPYETESGEWKGDSKDGTLTSFSTFDINGRYYDESLFASKKLTMVNAWTTWCGYCLMEMPYLGELSKDYSDNKNFQIVGVAADTTNDGLSFSMDTINQSRSLATQAGATYKQILPTRSLIKAQLSKAITVPYTFFVDSKGKVVAEEFGAKSKEDWQSLINSLLKKVSV